MGERAVVFDLFGTLVGPFPRQQHQQAIKECAALLGIDSAACQQHWVDSFPRRIRGDFESVADNFAWIVRQVGHEDPGPERLGGAAARYLRFTCDSLQPLPGVPELLGRLRSRGLRIGLVTNCAPDVPLAWDRSAFAGRVDACAFSCEVGRVKPEPEIFQHALDALGAPAEQSWYVGDGSDRELSGAAACGMHAVLVTNDLSNTYDSERADVIGWRGPVLNKITEVEVLVDGRVRRR